MRTTTKKRRTKTSRLAACIFVLLAVSAALAQKKSSEPFAVVRGTVFLESGTPQPGALVILAAKDQPKKKLQEQVSSPRGEFAFRVPAKPSAYIVSTTVKGFEPVSKDVDVSGPEEINRTLLLVPASKK